MLDIHVFFLVLVLCSDCHCQEDSISICVKSEEATSCQQKDIKFTISQLSGLPALLKDYSDVQTLYIYLTAGTHYLTTSLYLNISSNAEIQGEGFTTAIIQCMETSEIELLVGNLSIQNLLFNKCANKIILNSFQVVKISDSKFIVYSNNEPQYKLNINNSQFIEGHTIISDNTNIFHSLYSDDPVTIIVEGTCSSIKITASNSTFTSSALKIFILNINVLINTCTFTNYNGAALQLLSIVNYDKCSEEIQTKIINSLFTKNSRALEARLIGEQSVHISHCNFTKHHISIQPEELSLLDTTFAVVYIIAQRNDGIEISINIGSSNFRGNYYSKQPKGLDCASIYIENMQTEFDNVTVIDNNCTAMTLITSNVTIHNKVNLIRNVGSHGALDLGGSSVTIASKSQLYLINNTAHRYGGGIYNDCVCSSNYVDNCFLKMSPTPNSSNTIIFSGNMAKYGGDMMYGGCMSNCKIELNGKKEDVHIANSSNIFWDYASSDSFSQSAFVEEPTRVVFCDITNDNTHSICRNDTEMTFTVIRGQEFELPLMAVDNNCFPSAQHIIAKTDEGINIIWPGELRFTKHSCSNYSYAIGGNNMAQNVTSVQFYLNTEIFSNKPLIVTVIFTKCPIGYDLDTQGACSCDNTVLNISDLFQIKCIKSDFSLKIPALTWIGERDGDIIALSKNCRYCHKKTLTKILRDSNDLCTKNRAGILCGKCIEGYSLLISGDKCGECNGSILKGTVLSISLAIIGIVLILLLLTLNITVSTGFINALIFYSNIVYLNNNAFLPILDNTEHNHLQNVICFLSSFQAWMNLDFGISVCFFDHYNTYISAWSQFAYPIYIWLLILLIVCASRYSRRLAKLTASNIVPVLATLLLLSYSKLLTASINALSYSELHFIEANGINTIKVWELDGHILYLQGKHIPLFLMSILMTVAYTIPFTLLVLLGPLLQAKSHHRLLSWINRLKPLMDAFYGPYSNRYRYWPGILLLARIGLAMTFALSNGTNILTVITIMTTVLLVLWSVLGGKISLTPYQNKCLNYLELFFLFNLALFSIITEAISKYSKPIYFQQILALIMTGSGFAVFCCILTYQTACALSKLRVVHKLYRFALKCRVAHKLCTAIQGQRAEPTQEGNTEEGTAATGEGRTHSTITMASNELREPLLTK